MTQVFTFEELITNDLFIAYSIRREASALQYWQAYLEQFPDQAPVLEKARRTVILLHDTLAPLAADDAAEDFRRILEVPQAGAAVHRIRPWYGKATVAAALALAVAAAAWWLLPGKHPTAPQIIASAPGERKTVTLADGSSVILNANSQLILSPSFNKKNRDLTLRGEAFFDVHQDAGHPFIIHTRQMDVKVLGTSFNVMAYENDRKTETSLISGALEVTLKNGTEKTILLKPSQKVILENASRTAQQTAAPVMQVSNVNVQTKNKLITETAWTNDKLAFNDETLEEVAHKMERWYGVTIQVDSTIATGYHYTAVFEKESLPQALHVLQLILPFQYSINGTIVSISTNKKGE